MHTELFGFPVSIEPEAKFRQMLQAVHGTLPKEQVFRKGIVAVDLTGKETDSRDHLTSNTLPELDVFLESLTSKRLVVTFVNATYVDVFERWHSCFKNCCDEELLVASLDSEAFQRLNSLGIPSFPLGMESFRTFLTTKDFHPPEKRHLLRLWRIRWRVFQRIISHGIEVVHSDADALWLRNPLSEILSDESDLIASLSRRNPNDIADEWGFVLCMGFFVLRPTDASAKFISLVLKKMRSTRTTDQASANRILYEYGARWNIFDDRSPETYIESLDLRVSTISETDISRKNQGQPHVFHPYLKGDIVNKVAMLDEGLHEIRAREGRSLSYFKHNPILEVPESSDTAKEKLALIHIPRTGGTSFQDVFSLPGSGHLPAADLLSTESTYRVAVCRNPYSRLVSAFHYLTDRERPPERDQSESNYVYDYRNDFRGFVENAVNSFDVYRSVQLIPQWFFVCDSNEIAVDEIIPLERLSERIEPLIERFGGKIPIQHRNRSVHNDVDSYFDDRLRAIVARTYARDFALFGYDPSLDAKSGPEPGFRVT